MLAEWTPMLWPSAWRDASALSLLEGSGINYLLFDKEESLASVRARAKDQGIHVADHGVAPAEVRFVKGEWPGVRMSRGGGGPTAGPTGTAWVDSNGWRVQLSKTQHPDQQVWIDAAPKDGARLFPTSYLIAVADAASAGGRWIISLDKALVDGIAAQKGESIETWKRIAKASSFFDRHKEWSSYKPRTIIGVVSSFSGSNEFLSTELLNLLARAGQPSRILIKDKLDANSFDGLRAVIYPDAEAPSPALRQQLQSFTLEGGTLITGPAYGGLIGSPVRLSEHPRFVSLKSGKGAIALAKDKLTDPYVLAGDSVVLVSHRYDMVRFWNGGSTGYFLASSPDGKKTVAHLMFYSFMGPDEASVRIAGKYRSAKLLTVEDESPKILAIENQKDAIEVHLPQIAQYAALELEA